MKNDYYQLLNVQNIYAVHHALRYRGGCCWIFLDILCDILTSLYLKFVPLIVCQWCTRSHVLSEIDAP